MFPVPIHTNYRSKTSQQAGSPKYFEQTQVTQQPAIPPDTKFPGEMLNDDQLLPVNPGCKSNLGYPAPVKVLSQLYRAEFERILQQQGIAGLVAPELFRLPFIVDCRPVGDGVSAVKYLSRYVYRTAITNRRIVSLDDGHVTFRYRKRGATQDSTMTLPAPVFIARFLQHVLPRGLQKVRHYGFHSRASQTTLDAVRAAIEVARAEDEPDYELCAWSPPVLVKQARGEHVCSACGGPLEFVQVVKPLWRDTS